MSPITITANPAQNWNSDFTFTGTNALNLGTGAVTMNATRQVTVNGTGTTGVLTIEKFNLRHQLRFDQGPHGRVHAHGGKHLQRQDDGQRGYPEPRQLLGFAE